MRILSGSHQHFLSFIRKLSLGLLTVFAGLASAVQEYSPAERALFMTNHLNSIRSPTTLHYTFRRSGTLGDSFEDKVKVAMTTTANSGKLACCTAATEFLSGSRRVALPEIEAPTGNPVILHFLERDIQEMQRLTKGQANYFRKRIRLAVFEAAKVTDTDVIYGGKIVAAQQITITPYLEDPLRTRFEKFANKEYAFTLSSAVPGGLVSIRTRVNNSAPDGQPLLLEELVVDDGALQRPATNLKQPS